MCTIKSLSQELDINKTRVYIVQRDKVHGTTVKYGSYDKIVRW